MNLWVKTHHRKSPPATFGVHRHCGSGDMMLSVVEGKNSLCSCLNSPLLFISNGHGMKAHGMSYVKPYPGHTLPGQQMMRHRQKSFHQSINETPKRRKKLHEVDDNSSVFVKKLLLKDTKIPNFQLKLPITK